MKKLTEFTQQNILLAPDNKPTLYQVLDNDKKPMYVGVAAKKQFRFRLLGHLVVPHIPVAFFEFEQCKDLEQAMQKAITIVKKEHPEYNKFYEIDGQVIENGQPQLQLT